METKSTEFELMGNKIKPTSKLYHLIQSAKVIGVPFTKYDNVIGVRTGKFVYHWFDIISEDCLIFNHSYSQNTGSTKKGRRQRDVVLNSIAKKLGVLL